MTALPLDRLEELERLAKAATPGHWVLAGCPFEYARVEFDGGGRYFTLMSEGRECPIAFITGVDDDEERANSDYLVAAGPATILDLIQALRLSEAENAKLRVYVNTVIRAPLHADADSATLRRAFELVVAAGRMTLKDNPHD